ncbi:MAG: ATP-binding protein [Methyloprofundus sp.]|nr:ATP-binding protein [Methyloprofundus sp.]
MLLEYRITNFFGFKESTNVSFKLPTNCPKDISLGKDYTNILCVKGKNASGKTNLLKALSFLADFCIDSFSQKPDEEILLENFYDSKEDTEFFIEFKDGDTIFQYELILNKQNIVRETVYRKDQRRTKIIEREENKFTSVISELKNLKLMKLRQNVSFISTAKQYDLDNIQTVKSIYKFFDSFMSNVNHHGLNSKTPDVNLLCQLFYEEKTSRLFNFVKEIIISCDTGVKNIEIIKNESDSNEIKYIPQFIHEANGEDQRINYHAESSGTKSLFMQLARYKLILDNGGVLCLDEFDINLHPKILPLLIDLFLNPDKNTNDSQLIFTTHNSDIMDLLGRYRVYIVEKQFNESFAYRLDEIPGDILRNDRSISPIYNSGKIGGLPKI